MDSEELRILEYKKHKKTDGIRVTIIAIFIIGIVMWGITNLFTKSDTNVNYKLIFSNDVQTIVLLNEPIERKIDIQKLNFIADSIYSQNAPKQPEYGQYYRVWFYYREDWKGQEYFAGKFWQYDDKTHKQIPQKLDVTGITGNDKQDNINITNRVYR